ncbi:hypothetical protein SCHPADRAFT_898023 [Schizopora paradoxa]|uniref:Uncharacterized protein n=1 Tax=Schizopora paradoxa TaxID=27342 RepID=A0A0H2SUE8_9AGAM|nr:hypothetical protein SCHPADRAFT_898023 [Schizopora paradoxa]
MQEADVRARSTPAQEINEEDSDDDEPIYLIPPDTRRLFSERSTQPANSNLKKVRNDLTPSSITPSSPSHEPPASHKFNIPKIIITPAPPHPHEVSSLVPIQNAAFGSRLTVPSHISFNTAFPPMARPAVTSMPNAAVHRWTFENGHWCADVPKILDQERLGLFSRPVGLRRRAKACGRSRKPRTMRDIGVFVRPRRDP